MDIQNVHSVADHRRSNPQLNVKKVDRFLDNMKGLNPDLARVLGQQVEDLRKDGADPQQVLTALKQTALQLTGQDHLDFQAAVQGVQDDLQARNLRRHDSETGPPRENVPVRANNSGNPPELLDTVG